MTLKEQLEYVNGLLEQAVQNNDWEIILRLNGVIYFLQKDLIIEQDKIIAQLVRTA
jgi:hypothetical protein